MGNLNLGLAKKNPNNEFYTQLPDIERELDHYKEHLKGKVIFCNCDDPELSNFWKYFHLNFSQLGIKKLISTHFVYEDIFQQGETYKLEYEGGNDGDIRVGVKTILKENGDFRSKECKEILEKSDVVITNPPFSLFREYVEQLMEYKKKFVIIGNKNAITYKEIYTLIKENKLWIGNTPMGKEIQFDVPQYFAEELKTTKEEGSGYEIVDGVIKARSPITWFTNLDHKKRHENLILYKKYNKADYPKYDNYNGIEVGAVEDIPCDYDGVMGVTPTFFGKYNPEQFEIVSFRKGDDGKDLSIKGGTYPYFRILIKKKGEIK